MEQIDTLLPTLIAFYLGLAGLLFPVFLVAIVRQRRRLPKLALAHQEELDALRAEHKEQLSQLEVTQSKALAKYSAIISVEDEVAKLEEERQELVKRAEREGQDIDARRRAEEDQIESLRASYKEKRGIYDRLKKELAIFDERLSLAELGVYEPHFDFGDSDAFKAAINAVREDQKSMVSGKTAVYCTTTWTVDGSQSKGQTMINRAVRLTLRAFNNECEAAINARYCSLFNRNAFSAREVETLEKLWVLRHSVAHNAGMIIHYDATRIGDELLADHAADIDADFISETFRFLNPIAKTICAECGGNLLREQFQPLHDRGPDFVADTPVYSRLKPLFEYVESRAQELSSIDQPSYEADFAHFSTP